jgi:hypothetical protein
MEAFPQDEAPHSLIRDRDRIYGNIVKRRLRACIFSRSGIPWIQISNSQVKDRERSRPAARCARVVA